MKKDFPESLRLFAGKNQFCDGSVCQTLKLIFHVTKYRKKARPAAFA
jgi:hypothetical protein